MRAILPSTENSSRWFKATAPAITAAVPDRACSSLPRAIVPAAAQAAAVMASSTIAMIRGRTSVRSARNRPNQDNGRFPAAGLTAANRAIDGRTRRDARGHGQRERADAHVQCRQRGSATGHSRPPCNASSQKCR